MSNKYRIDNVAKVEPLFNKRDEELAALKEKRASSSLKAEEYVTSVEAVKCEALDGVIELLKTEKHELALAKKDLEAKVKEIEARYDVADKAHEEGSMDQKAYEAEYKTIRNELIPLHKELLDYRKDLLKKDQGIIFAKKDKLEASIKKIEGLLKANKANCKAKEIEKEEFLARKEALEAELKELEKAKAEVKREAVANEQAQFLLMSKGQKFGYKFVRFFESIPEKVGGLGKKIAKGLKKLVINIGLFFKGLWDTFIHGDWKTKISYFIMGFGSIARGQWLRGILFLLFEVVFILYIVLFGGHYLGRLYILGTVESVTGDDGTVVYGENSFNILLYGVLTIFFIIAFAYTWYVNVKQNRIAEQIIKDERKLATAKDDLRAMVDKNFHTTLLALPTLGIIIFTVLPIFFMILVAFTTYDANHNPPLNLFGWAGFDNFAQLFKWTNSGGASFSMTFGQILLWTLVWAFFATFTNYFLGMLVAMLINKKGIKLKKLWRTILVFSIAIPQFISILYVSKMFASDGIINNAHMWIQRTIFKAADPQPIPFWDNQWLARITVIIINIWIGVPYLMLIVTGILMNIPADLYESANIDGASPWQQYSKITLPYMLFITGPYLLTSFTGNMNNFNVIYLLTGGGPKDINMFGNAGKTDLLITWLFSLAINDSNYKLAAVIGIMVFIVVAVVSLVVYNIIPSTKNEEEFQ